ncbi:serine protease inhibitor [Lasioglossum baleicum]|uniref:serine protease inhibitor n=1 Tax=Lasioglossum baleicum TaxID=434251 RepID=UPI003FCC29F1
MCSSASYILMAFLVLIVSQETMATVLYKPEVVQVEACGANEVYSSCGGNPDCEKSCDNIDTWVSVGCTFRRVCIAGCVCDEGFVRDANHVCVWSNMCPRVRH